MNLLLSLDRAFIYTFHVTGLFLFPQKMSEIRVFIMFSGVIQRETTIADIKLQNVLKF